MENDEIALDPAYVSWSPNSRKIAMIRNNRAMVWDVRSGELLFVYIQENQDEGRDVERERLTGISWMPSNQELFVESLYYDHTIVAVIEVETGGVLKSVDIGRNSGISWIFPDGTKMEEYSQGNFGCRFTSIVDTISWEWAGGYGACEFERLPDPNHNRSQYAVSEGGIIHILDGNTLETVYELDSPVDTTAQFVWSADDSKFVVLTRAELQIWDVALREMIAKNTFVSGMDWWRGDASINILGWNSDGRYFAIDNDGAVSLWDMRTKQTANVLYGEWFIGFPQWGAPNSSEIVTVEGDRYFAIPKIIIRDALTGDVFRSTEDGVAYLISPSAWSPDGGYMAGVRGRRDMGDAIDVVDIATMDIMITIESEREVESVIWHPFHNMLILTTYDEETEQYFIDINDVLTGEQLFSMPMDESTVSLSFAGNLLAMENDGAITVWSLARNGDEITLEQVYEFAYDGVSLREVRWHQYENKMAAVGTVNDDETYLYFWDLSGAEPMMMTAAVPAEIVEFAWRPDGTITFATVDDDNTINILEEIP